MSYQVNYTDFNNKDPLTVEDMDINDDTSLKFPGRGVTEYGSYIAENFLHILENFASPEPPGLPVEGQTWYDTSTEVSQLKIYDGTRWVPASGIFKATTTSAVSSATAGDLWVDTDNQQLYLKTNSDWVLVGPEFSQGSSTGPRSVILSGTDDISYPVLIIDVDDIPVVIFSGSQFIPKTAINGFTKIQPGVNISTRTLHDGQFKFYGLAETAESLKIQNKNVPATNFLRADIDTTANGVLRVRNNQGIQVGESDQLSLQTSSLRSLIRNNFSGGGTDFQVKQDDNYRTALRINSTSEGPVIGINTLNPMATLDVEGTLGVSGFVTITDTTQTDIQTGFSNTGALQVSGGASVAKNLNVGETVKVNGAINVSENLIGSGSSNITGFNTIEATTFKGDLIGTFVGDVSGTASYASRLVNTTTFSLSGDVVSSPGIEFNGAPPFNKVFNTTISTDFISNKPLTDISYPDDEILINRVTGDSLGLFRTTQSKILESVPTTPIGLIAPFGGEVAPPGWHFCDGSIELQADYQELFDVIGHRFLDTAELANLGLSSGLYFGFPDFRGRFPLGLDNMGGTSANRVTSQSADILGNSGGAETTDIFVKNLPAHDHDLRSSALEANQYYAIKDSAYNELTDSPDAKPLNIGAVAATDSAVSGIPTSGQITAGGQTGQNDYRTVAGEQVGDALDVMNPYTAVNYIIWTGKVDT